MVAAFALGPCTGFPRPGKAGTESLYITFPKEYVQPCACEEFEALSKTPLKIRAAAWYVALDFLVQVQYFSKVTARSGALALVRRYPVEAGALRSTHI